ncbi:MAG: hypothetical protein WDN66_03415 [Candidatus Saccharibacteria bacterium]
MAHFPKACMLNLGLEYEPMILKIAELGLSRRIEDEVSIPELTALETLVSPSTKAILKPI